MGVWYIFSSCITFFTLVFGEVVPKRLALAYPEAVAVALAAPVHWLLRLCRPLVWVVSRCADLVLGLLPVKAGEEASAADEIRFLIESSRKEGALDQTEGEILGNVFRLDNRKVAAIMPPNTPVPMDFRAAAPAPVKSPGGRPRE